MGGFGYWLIGNPFVFSNNQKLENAVKSIKCDSVYLNDVVPFEWDILYTFAPYQSKKEIEQIVGFKSSSIKENNINEGMVHLLFVKDKKVVASVLGYADNLGYSIDFAMKPNYDIAFSENAEFRVTRENGTVSLIYVE